MRTANVLVVCRGNVRRSPVIAAMLETGTATTRGLGGTGVSVASAGIAAVVGSRIDPILGSRLEALGMPDAGHLAAQLRPEAVQRADVVITACRSHRRAVTQMAPSAVRRVFTLRELAALASNLDLDVFDDCGESVADRLRRLVEMAPRARSRRLERRPRMDDVADPTRMTARAAARMLNEIQGSVEAILQLIQPSFAVVGGQPEHAGHGQAIGRLVPFGATEDGLPAAG